MTGQQQTGERQVSEREKGLSDGLRGDSSIIYYKLNWCKVLKRAF